MAKGNWRDTLDRKLLNILKRDGMAAFLQTATAMLSVDPGGDNQLKAQFVGEVCEVVFWGLTKKYLDAKGVEAKIYHSVVLKDLNNPKSDFRTECDFVLVSPSFMLTTECKSFGGGIRVSGDCTLVHRGKEADVYRQSKLHYDKLNLYAQQLLLPSARVAPPVFADVFVFSNSEIKDERSQTAKQKIRIHTSSSLFDYYDRLFSAYNNRVYDYERACKIFKVCSASKALHSQHGDYVGYSD